MNGPAEDVDVSRFLASWFEIRQFIQAANFNHFHKAGLSATQFMILNLLPDRRRTLSIGELAKRMNLAPATVARAVDTLETRKMLEREKSTDDGRLVLLRITREGGKLQNAAEGHFRSQISEIFRSIPDTDREALLNGLESFVRATSLSKQDPGQATPAAHADPPAKHSSRQSRRR